MRFLTPRDLGALVRDARISAGLTQTALGRKIGASRFWVAEFERGKSGAELGLALKALRALGLVLTVEPEGHALRGAQAARPVAPITAHVISPGVNLSTIVDRARTWPVFNPHIHIDAFTGESRPANDRIVFNPPFDVNAGTEAAETKDNQAIDKTQPRGARKRKRS